MKHVDCKTQQELNDALRRGDYPNLVGSGVFEISGNSQATLTGNSQATLYGNSQARLYGNSQVIASGSAVVVAGKYNAVTVHGKKVKCSGGVRIDIPQIATAKEWCDFHGVEVKRGIAVLFKAVDDDYSTSNARPRGIFYKPGEKPIADDWDGGLIECGRGLHFSPSPDHALRFNTEAKHFIACPVKISGIKVHKNAMYPEKVKCRGVSKPVYEVNINGEPI